MEDKNTLASKKKYIEKQIRLVPRGAQGTAAGREGEEGQGTACGRGPRAAGEGEGREGQEGQEVSQQTVVEGC